MLPVSLITAVTAYFYYLYLLGCMLVLGIIKFVCLYLADDVTMSSMSQLRDSSMASADSSFDMLSSLIPAGQRSMRQLTTTQVLQVRATPEVCTPLTSRSVTSASGDQLVRFSSQLPSGCLSR